MTSESAVQTLKKEDGVWKYYVGDKFAPETTLVKYSGVWFYVEDGVWNKTATTLVKYEDKWFYVKNGKWSSEPTTLVKYKDKWYVYRRCGLLYLLDNFSQCESQEDIDLVVQMMIDEYLLTDYY